MREVNDLEKLDIVDLFISLVLFSARSSTFPWEDGKKVLLLLNV